MSESSQIQSNGISQQESADGNISMPVFSDSALLSKGDIITDTNAAVTSCALATDNNSKLDSQESSSELSMATGHLNDVSISVAGANNSSALTTQNTEEIEATQKNISSRTEENITCNASNDHFNIDLPNNNMTDTTKGQHHLIAPTVTTSTVLNNNNEVHEEIVSSVVKGFQNVKNVIEYQQMQQTRRPYPASLEISNAIQRTDTGFSVVGMQPVFKHHNCPCAGWQKNITVQYTEHPLESELLVSYTSLSSGRSITLRNTCELFEYFISKRINLTELSQFDYRPVACICHTVADHSRLYLQCSCGFSGCNGWVHPECVGLGYMNESELRQHPPVVCPLCAQFLIGSKKTDFLINLNAKILSNITVTRSDPTAAPSGGSNNTILPVSPTNGIAAGLPHSDAGFTVFQPNTVNTFKNFHETSDRPPVWGVLNNPTASYHELRSNKGLLSGFSAYSNNTQTRSLVHTLARMRNLSANEVQPPIGVVTSSSSSAGDSNSAVGVSSSGDIVSSNVSGDMGSSNESTTTKEQFSSSETQPQLNPTKLIVRWGVPDRVDKRMGMATNATEKTMKEDTSTTVEMTTVDRVETFLSTTSSSSIDPPTATSSTTLSTTPINTDYAILASHPAQRSLLSETTRSLLLGSKLQYRIKYDPKTESKHLTRTVRPILGGNTTNVHVIGGWMKHYGDKVGTLHFGDSLNGFQVTSVTDSVYDLAEERRMKQLHVLTGSQKRKTFADLCDTQTSRKKTITRANAMISKTATQMKKGRHTTTSASSSSSALTTPFITKSLEDGPPKVYEFLDVLDLQGVPHITEEHTSLSATYRSDILDHAVSAATLGFSALPPQCVAATSAGLSSHIKTVKGFTALREAYLPHPSLAYLPLEDGGVGFSNVQTNMAAATVAPKSFHALCSHTMMCALCLSFMHTPEEVAIPHSITEIPTQSTSIKTNNHNPTSSESSDDGANNIASISKGDDSNNNSTTETAPKKSSPKAKSKTAMPHVNATSGYVNIGKNHATVGAVSYLLHQHCAECWEDWNEELLYSQQQQITKTIPESVSHGYSSSSNNEYNKVTDNNNSSDATTIAMVSTTSSDSDIHTTSNEVSVSAQSMLQTTQPVVCFSEFSDSENASKIFLYGWLKYPTVEAAFEVECDLCGRGGGLLHLFEVKENCSSKSMGQNEHWKAHLPCLHYLAESRALQSIDYLFPEGKEQASLLACMNANSLPLELFILSKNHGSNPASNNSINPSDGTVKTTTADKDIIHSTSTASLPHSMLSLTSVSSSSSSPITNMHTTTHSHNNTGGSGSSSSSNLTTTNGTSTGTTSTWSVQSAPSIPRCRLDMVLNRWMCALCGRSKGMTLRCAAAGCLVRAHPLCVSLYIASGRGWALCSIAHRDDSVSSSVKKETATSKQQNIINPSDKSFSNESSASETKMSLEASTEKRKSSDVNPHMNDNITRKLDNQDDSVLGMFCCLHSISVPFQSAHTS